MREPVLRFSQKDGEELLRSEVGSYEERSAPVEVGSEYEVTIEDVAQKGDGIARIEGFVIFVPDAKVGETLKIQVDKVLRRFAIAHKA